MSVMKRCQCQASLEVRIRTKLNARLAIRQRADLFEGIIWADKISLAQG